MTLQNWQLFFHIVVLVGAIITAGGVFGANYMGKKIIEENEKIAIERENVLKHQRDEAIEELKVAINQIPAQQAMIETRKKLNELRAKAMSDAQRKAVTGRR